MKDYEVGLTRISSSFFGRLARMFGLTGMRTYEFLVIRTEKTLEEIKNYYENGEIKVFSITECLRTKNQEVPII